jgi:hypothetical protein
MRYGGGAGGGGHPDMRAWLAAIGRKRKGGEGDARPAVRLGGLRGAKMGQERDWAARGKEKGRKKLGHTLASWAALS